MREEGNGARVWLPYGGVFAASGIGRLLSLRGIKEEGNGSLTLRGSFVSEEGRGRPARACGKNAGACAIAVASSSSSDGCRSRCCTEGGEKAAVLSSSRRSRGRSKVLSSSRVASKLKKASPIEVESSSSGRGFGLCEGDKPSNSEFNTLSSVSSHGIPDSGFLGSFAKRLLQGL